MSEDGTYLPHNQTSDLIEKVSCYLKEIKPKELVLNGDVKHSFHEPTKIENRDVRHFLKSISTHVEKITIVKGNHDILLNWAIKGIQNIEFLKEDYLVGRYFFMHGDKNLPISLPEEVKYVIIGHEHPIFESRVNKLQKVRAPAFLMTPLKNRKINLIVLPAFSDYSSGTPIHPKFRENFLSPILRKEADLNQCELFVLDQDKQVLHFPSFKEWI